MDALSDLAAGLAEEAWTLRRCGLRIPETSRHLTTRLSLRFHLETFLSLGLRSFLILKRLEVPTPLRVVLLNVEPRYELKLKPRGRA